MKTLLQIIGLFLLQNLLELLLMAVLAKVGVQYMDYNAGGEGIIELIGGIAYYYSMSKVLITVLPYIILMLLGEKYVFKHAELAVTNIFISLVLTIVFWVYFDNPVREIVNPVLGTLIAGLFIFFVGRSIRKKTFSPIES